MEGGEEGAVLTLQGPRPLPRTPSPSPRARPTWPLVRAFLRRLSANWQQDRKGSRQAGCCTRATRCSQVRAMGSRVSPSWQQRLATGEVYWPTAGPGEGEPEARLIPSRPLDAPGLTPRDQELEGGHSRAPPQPPFHPRTTVSAFLAQTPCTGSVGSRGANRQTCIPSLGPKWRTAYV